MATRDMIFRQSWLDKSVMILRTVTSTGKSRTHAGESRGHGKVRAR